MSKPIDQDAGKTVAASAIAEIAAWRAKHPVATFDEIEHAVTERMRPLREQVLTDAMQVSAQATFGQGVDRPVCPTCGEFLQVKGRKRRRIVTHQGEEILLERNEGTCPRCGAGFFPPGS